MTPQAPASAPQKPASAAGHSAPQRICTRWLNCAAEAAVPQIDALLLVPSNVAGGAGTTTLTNIQTTGIAFSYTALTGHLNVTSLNADAGTVASLLRAAELASAADEAGDLAPPPQRPSA